MSTTNTKIWFLLKVTAALFCGCAAPITAAAGGLSKQDRDVVTAIVGRTPTRYEMTIFTAVITAARRNISVVERATGRQRKDWTKADTKLWQDLNARALFAAMAEEERKAETKRRVAGAVAGA